MNYTHRICCFKPPFPLNFCSSCVEQSYLFNFLIQFNFNMNGANIKIIEIQFKYIDIQ